MKETANSIQRTCLTHLPSIKSWFIPVLLRTLCIMWQCTTVQWSGLHFVTLGGRGDRVRGGVTGQLFSEVTLERRVLIPASTRTAYLFFCRFFSRVIKDSGLRFVVCFWKSLGLVYHHGCSLTSARHCCELLIFWVDVIESQLFGWCDGISAGIGQWWGENIKYKKTLQNSV